MRCSAAHSNRRYTNYMSNSNALNPSSFSRVTLKLKPGTRKSPREIRSAAPRPAPAADKLKPGARWSDEHRERMQMEMDGLRVR